MTKRDALPRADVPTRVETLNRLATDPTAQIYYLDEVEGSVRALERRMECRMVFKGKDKDRALDAWLSLPAAAVWLLAEFGISSNRNKAQLLKERISALCDRL